MTSIPPIKRITGIATGEIPLTGPNHGRPVVIAVDTVGRGELDPEMSREVAAVLHEKLTTHLHG
jgi:hypothetical protein